MSRQSGSAAEEIANNFLKKLGYRVVDRNVCYPFGELDLVAWEGHTLVFIEVKYRKSLFFGLPLEAVNNSKQKKIIKAAKAYLQHHKGDMPACRFDVVAISGKIGQEEIEHIKDAFWDEGL